MVASIPVAVAVVAVGTDAGTVAVAGASAPFSNPLLNRCRFAGDTFDNC
jgi:hypothetical protein